jgi:hypothetical protein
MSTRSTTTVSGAGPVADTERPRTYCEAFQRIAAVDPDAVALRTVGGT